MKTLVALFFSAMTFIFCQSSAFAVDMTNPYKLANEVATSTFESLTSNKDKLTDKAFLTTLIKKDLLPYIDVKYAAYKVIGTNLKNTTEGERDRFTAAFEEYLVQSLASVCSKYSLQKVATNPEQPLKADENMVSVKFAIQEDGKPDLELVLKMRKNKKTGEWKAFDLIAENISILDAKQSEIGPIIKDKGIETAIKTLQEKTTAGN